MLFTGENSEHEVPGSLLDGDISDMMPESSRDLDEGNSEEESLSDGGVL